jgi:hypothetical protein
MTARGATAAVIDLYPAGLATAFNHQLPPSKDLVGVVTTVSATFATVNPTTGQLWPRSGQSG